MSFLSLTRPAVAPTRYSTEQPPSLLARLLAAIAREVRLRRDMRALAELDDAGLHDIGLSRGEVEHAVRHGRFPDHSPMQLERVSPRSRLSAPCSTPWG